MWNSLEILWRVEIFRIIGGIPGEFLEKFQGDSKWNSLDIPREFLENFLGNSWRIPGRTPKESLENSERSF